VSKIKNMADAFRIWQYANPRDWDVTSAEIGEALDLETKRVSNICTARGWNKRMPNVPRVSGSMILDTPSRRPTVRLDEVRSCLGLPAC